MRLSPGMRLGAYEITAALGAGGMGEVYRARDTKLGRDVALKTLPDIFATERDRLMRFEREARTLASLNHPSIAQAYGIEDSTAVRALVMELVEGEDLSARIARGPVPLEDALPIARQIADALEAAHGHGIVHRDLKPRNIKIRVDGTVKVLDFGLAKALDPSAPRGNASPPGDDDLHAVNALANSPTMASPTMTSHGVILGTAAYMAPEQAKGRAVDRRADVWAFGCVLYEMLAGRKAFDGEDVTDTLTAVLRDSPDWTALPDATPREIRTLLRRCLEKDPRKRPGDLSIARLDIDDALAVRAWAESVPGPASSVAAARLRWRERAAWGLAVAAALAAGWIGLRLAAPVDSPAPPGRFTLEVPPAADGGTAAFIALAPDSTSIAMQSSGNATPTPIYVRRLDAAAFTAIPGSERLRLTAWSMDGGSLLAMTRLGLRASTREADIAWVDISSGHARSVARLPDGLVPFTAVEGPGGAVLVGISGQPLHVVSGPGADPVPIAALDTAVREVEHQSPVFLPDGRRFFYASVRDGHQLTTRLRSLDSNEVHDLAGVDGRLIWADDRHVIFRREASLFVQALGFAPLALQGRPVRLADSATLLSFLPRQPLAAATAALLAYRTGSQAAQQFTWFGRDGTRLGTIGPEGVYTTFDLSRDGARLVASRSENASSNLWVLDTTTGTFNRVTSGSAVDLDPRVSPDGRTVIFGSTRDATRSPFRASLMGQDLAERVLPFRGQIYSNDDWSGDGRWLVYHDASVPVLHATRLDRPEEPPVVVARALTGIIDQARMSHDGRWVAYNSTEGGRAEIFVVPFPPTGDRWQVSAGGGVQPIWGQRDRELYYLALDGMLMAVPIRATAPFAAGPARGLFQAPLTAISGDTEQYAVAPDGSRFLFAPSTGAARPDVITVVTNWRSLLERPRE